MSLMSEIDRTLKRTSPKLDGRIYRGGIVTKRLDFDNPRQLNDNSTYLHTIISQTTRCHFARASIAMSKGHNSTVLSHQHTAGVRNSTDFDKENHQ